MADELRAPLTARLVHLCVDMQRLFSAQGPWPTPWLDRVLPVVAGLADRFAERTVFTRFIPPPRPEEMPGCWRRYYERWRQATREHLDPALIELLPELAKLVPPAQVIDKSRYSAFALTNLSQHLAARSADALIVTGAETDVCVLATVALAPAGATPAQAALRWVIQQPGVSTVIPGARNAVQAEQNAAAAALPPFSDADLAAIADLYDRRIRAQVHDRW